jgi:hypothetical protein
LNIKLKYSISIVFFVAGIGILGYGFYSHPTHYHENQLTGLINEPVDLQIFGERITRLTEGNPSNQPVILPIMLLTTKACTPCINNVTDYAQLLKVDPLFFDLTLIFADEEKSAAERFVVTSNLDISFEVIDTREAGYFFRNSNQNLIFVDMETKTVFYNIAVPNGETPLPYKEEELKNISGIWDNLFHLNVAQNQ